MSFSDAFFFSVQTVRHAGLRSHGAAVDLSRTSVVTAEVFLGLFNLAVATGLLFARISRPTARIMFSDTAVVTPFEGQPTLIFRAANRRRNLVVEAEVSVSLSAGPDHGGRGHDASGSTRLKTVRARTPLFFLTWTVMHQHRRSPVRFAGVKRRDSLIAEARRNRGHREGSSTRPMLSTIHARTSYAPDEIVWGRRLADIFVTSTQRRPIHT